MNIQQHLEALREYMRRVNVDAVIVPGTDPHHSEYVCDHYKFRDWLTGFDGSNGTAVVTLEQAALWTDSRYFLQAEQQLEGTGIVLMREGDYGDPSITEWLAEHLGEDDVLAIDGRLFTVNEVNRYDRFCGEHGFMLATDFAPADRVWTDRPPMPAAPAFVHELQYAGEDIDSKVEALVAVLDRVGATSVLLTALDDIAWLYNLRGDDILYTPVVTAFAFVSAGERSLFIDPAKVTPQVKEHLRAAGVHIREYDDIVRYLERKRDTEYVLLDPDSVSDTLAQALPCGKVYSPSPVAALKAVKNEVQIQGFRDAHLRDGVALTRLMCWLETAVARGEATECNVAARIAQLRAEGSDLYREESFAAIVGYNEHGAIVHYEPTPATSSELRPEGLVLIDTGGQYLDGTTDVTRTIALGEVSDEMRRDYTLVLKGHLALQAAVFPVGTTGVQLDALARMPLWQQGFTYGHGTGHGVGHFLGCHEGPQSIRTNLNPAILRAGMVTSDEPGIYRAGKYGIRIENLLLCVNSERSNDEFGEFLCFEPLTLLPYDRRLIDVAMLTAAERAQVDEYHARVATALLPLLDADSAAWLKRATAPL